MCVKDFINELIQLIGKNALKDNGSAQEMYI